MTDLIRGFASPWRLHRTDPDVNLISDCSQPLSGSRLAENVSNDRLVASFLFMEVSPDG
jgi:hypothetical protein